MKKLLTLSILLTVTLVGCVQTEPYQAPIDSPTANIRSNIFTRGRHNEISIYIYDDKKINKMFEIRGSDTLKEKGFQEVKVEANKIFEVEYFESLSGDRYCEIYVKAQFEPNKNYQLVGGARYEKGLIPFLPHRQCQFGIVEMESGKVVSKTAD